jgi:hypothetical protein|tara:strand:- start:3102 stop:3512 length:411 start_codon:yes stop_codon:yes gene_type:complete
MIQAYTAAIGEDGFIIGTAILGETGYYPQPVYGKFDTWDEASKRAKELNNDLGLEADEVMAIIGSSMRTEETYPEPINEISYDKSFGVKQFEIKFVIEEQNEETANDFLRIMMEAVKVDFSTMDYDILELVDPKFR